ncbi:pentatricopeptide repeat-containing protein At1g06145 [Ananas comosus]|uniref:Pentatricopeptide repeat-containing protein At1g06145 n=1 Tax=Ananas comosus TaxID=4615 RepID=A0A6P5E9K6_ANACO|nr:pentatricopeptide repeat-containing protein At1g06145 [Ananas comosus]
MTVKPKNPATALSRFSFTPKEHLVEALQNHNKPLPPHYSNHPITSQLQRCHTFLHLKSIHANLIKTNLNQDPFFMNQFVATSSSLRQIDHAYQAFAEMSDPNSFVYNAIIGGLVQYSRSREALELYMCMLKTSIQSTSYTFSYLIKACAQIPSLGLGEAVHGQIRKLGFGSQLVVQTGLIDFYSNFERIGAAMKVFDEMRERDVVSWTAMLFAYARAGDMELARKLFDEMPQRSTVSWNTMIAGYARLGNVEMAASLFNEMPNRDIVSWTTMICCYSRNKCFREAIVTFEAMISVGISPDEVTMATVISASAHLGALDLGRELHLYLMLNRFAFDVYMGSALIDMYAKCGRIEKALLVFYKLEKKNIYCWNCIIEGLAVHGLAKEALNMFDRMKKVAKINPNGISFLSVLSACNHTGLVEEGRKMFSSMIEDYSISPEIEHYGCMVDLLSRAGLLKEAFSLVNSMEIEPNSVIWGALLSGCKIHGNMEIGAVAMKKLLDLEPSNSAHYMLLVNMYAEGNRWDEVAEIRTKVKAGEVEKRGKGCSWIEIDRIVHEFAACDFSHPLSDEIEVMLAELNGQLRIAVYLPELHITPESIWCPYCGCDSKIH